MFLFVINRTVPLILLYKFSVCDVLFLKLYHTLLSLTFNKYSYFDCLNIIKSYITWSSTYVISSLFIFFVVVSEYYFIH